MEVKVSTQDLEALALFQKLQGISTDNIAQQASDFNDDTDDIEIIIEDERPKKKTARATKTKKSEEKKSVTPVIEMLEHFKALNRTETINVILNSHDIHYKEQLWPVPQRIVEYNIMLIKTPMEAKNVALDVFKNKSNANEEGNKAYKGDIRWLKVSTNDTVPYRVGTVAYIRVECSNGKLLPKIYVNNNVEKEGNIKAASLRKSIEGKLPLFVK